MITNRNGDCDLNSYAIAGKYSIRSSNMDEIEIEMTEIRSTPSEFQYDVLIQVGIALVVYYVRDA